MKKIWKFLVLIIITIISFAYFTINTVAIAAEMKIYFYLPDDWNSDVVYINYWNVPNDTSWPGYQMTFEREASGGKVYSYSLSNSVSSQTNIGIVFSIGNNNYQTVNIDSYTMEYLNGKLIIPTQREYITGGNYLIECRTYTANDPIGEMTPTDPTEPTEPVEPTDPVEPTEPTDPVEPTNPTESTDPTDPTDPTDSTNETKIDTSKNNSITNNNLSSTSKDSTTAKSIIPKTGMNINILMIILLISIIISVYFLIKYRQYRKM